jgi:DNA-binding beta-propeller fold protein YncE
MRFLSSFRLILLLQVAVLVAGCSFFVGSKPEAAPVPPEITAPLDDEGYGRVELLASLAGEPLSSPAGVAVSPTGDVYVSDAARQVVFKFPGGDLQAPPELIGSEGGRPGQFVHPRDLAVDGAGNLYVLDDGNSRVQKIGPDGKPLVQVGSREEFADYFNLQDGYDEPLSALAVDGSGYIYVGVSGANYDISPHALVKYAPDGRKLWEVKSTLEGDVDVAPFAWPDALTVDEHGTLYLAHGANGTGKILLLPQKDGHVDKATVRDFGLLGKGPGEFMHTPAGIALTASGDILVSDTYNNRLQLFNPEGKLIAMYRLKGLPTAEFDRPGPLAVASDGSVYVVDEGNKRVLKLRLVPPPGAGGAGPERG